jgi:guanidinobutyrase
LPAYLSNDIDGTDDSVADACGTPEPNGLEPEWVRELILRLGKEVGLVGGDVMEVAPGLARRHDGVTVALASDYVRDTLHALLETNPSQG